MLDLVCMSWMCHCSIHCSTCTCTGYHVPSYDFFAIIVALFPRTRPCFLIFFQTEYVFYFKTLLCVFIQSFKFAQKRGKNSYNLWYIQTCMDESLHNLLIVDYWQWSILSNCIIGHSHAATVAWTKKTKSWFVLVMNPLPIMIFTQKSVQTFNRYANYIQINYIQIGLHACSDWPPKLLYSHSLDNEAKEHHSKIMLLGYSSELPS